MKLYRVQLKGMTYTAGSNTIYGVSYVIAPDETTAYQKVKIYLDKRDLGFTHERVLNKIELMAESGDYPECGIILYE